MNAKQTPLVDILRLHAEDLHSDYGHNKSARLLSQAADEIDRLRAELAAVLAANTDLQNAFSKEALRVDSLEEELAEARNHNSGTDAGC